MRAVVLGGVPDRLVDGQPQVGRVDHQVVAAGPRRWAPSSSRRSSSGSCGQLVVPVPARAGQVLPAAAGGRGERAHRLEPAGGPVDGGGGDVGCDPDPLLDRRGAGQVGVELVLPHLEHAGADVVDAVGGEQPLRPLGQQVDLVAGGHRERVDVVGRHPGQPGVHRLAGPLDPLDRHRGEACGPPRPPARRPPPPVRASARRARRSPTPRRRSRGPRGPSVTESDTPVTAPSRRPIDCPTRRSTRMSACWAPSSRARPRAASASAESGSAVNSASTSGIPPTYWGTDVHPGVSPPVSGGSVGWTVASAVTRRT